MAKKYLTEEDMEHIEAFIADQKRVNDRQNKLLDEILLCLKGSESMNIEGVIPAQREIEKTLKELKDWKSEMTIYLTLVFSKRVWRVLGILAVCIVATILMFKFGFWTVWKYIKELFA